MTNITHTRPADLGEADRALKAKNRAMWALGDYAAVATQLDRVTLTSRAFGNEHLGPFAEKWLDVIGRGNAAAFDRHGWSYFRREGYDEFYPGYGSSWPLYAGAIGMTYETDGGG